MTTSESALQILIGEGGYRELPKAFKVGSLSFEFDHALVAGERGNDLVLIIELKGDTADDAIVRKILALTRALDVLQSRRSVTAVLTSGQAAPETVHSISRVCRVLAIGAPTGPTAIDTVRDWLSVLLPLSQPAAVDTLIDWEGDLRRRVPTATAGVLMDELLGVATKGREAVEEVLANSIRRYVEPVLEEGRGNP
jgi:hypothetical protein